MIVLPVLHSLRVDRLFIMRSPGGPGGLRDDLLLAAHCRLILGGVDRLTCALYGIEARLEAAGAERRRCLVSPLATACGEISAAVADALYAGLSSAGRARFGVVVVSYLARQRAGVAR